MTQFGLRPPELLALFNNLGTYYRWFLVDGKIAVEDFDSEIQQDLFESSWIDCLQRKIKFRKKALPEIMSWCEKRKLEIETRLDFDNPELIVIDLFTQINEIVMQGDQNNIDNNFLRHIKKNLMYDDKDEDFLPVIVHS